MVVHGEINILQIGGTRTPVLHDSHQSVLIEHLKDHAAFLPCIIDIVLSMLACSYSIGESLLNSRTWLRAGDLQLSHGDFCPLTLGQSQDGHRARMNFMP